MYIAYSVIIIPMGDMNTGAASAQKEKVRFLLLLMTASLADAFT